MSAQQVSVLNSMNVLAEIEQAYWDIPFENSAFQTTSFVIASQVTPERAYRAIGLQMLSKMQALHEAKYQREISKIECEELQEQIDDLYANKFDRAKAEAKLRHIAASSVFADKLLNDLLSDLNLLYSEFQKFPKYTREQFEAAEHIHFEQRLVRQIKGCTGAAEGIVNMMEDAPAIIKYQESVQQLTMPTDKQLLELLGSMKNQFKEPINV